MTMQAAFNKAAIVKDDRDRPLVLFHGTQADFRQFDMAHARDVGMHFGTLEQARHFAGDRGRIFAVHLAIERPIRLEDHFGHSVGDAQGMLWNLMEAGLITDERRLTLWAEMAPRYHDGEAGARACWRTIREIITGAGHDGVVYENRNEEEGEDESWIALYEHQIQVRLARPVCEPHGDLEQMSPW